jgi:hypothetical protein
MLTKAWETYLQMVATNSKMELHNTKCFGKFTVRLMLFLTQKQKMSKETKSWDSMHDILAAFTQEVQDPPTSSSGTEEPATAEALEVKDILKASPKEVAQLQNHHMKIDALHLGISIGKLCLFLFFCHISFLWPYCCLAQVCELQRAWHQSLPAQKHW